MQQQRDRNHSIDDKGKAAVLVVHVRSYDAHGKEVLFNEFTLFLRGAGGFGGAPGISCPRFVFSTLLNNVQPFHLCMFIVASLIPV